jgi:hypothetical protein
LQRVQVNDESERDLCDIGGVMSDAARRTARPRCAGNASETMCSTTPRMSPALRANPADHARIEETDRAPV